MKFRNTVMSILLLIFLVSVVISFSYNKREISAGGYGVSNPIMKMVIPHGIVCILEIIGKMIQMVMVRLIKMIISSRLSGEFYL